MTLDAKQEFESSSSSQSFTTLPPPPRKEGSFPAALPNLSFSASFLAPISSCCLSFPTTNMSSGKHPNPFALPQPIFLCSYDPPSPKIKSEYDPPSPEIKSEYDPSSPEIKSKYDPPSPEIKSEFNLPTPENKSEYNSAKFSSPNIHVDPLPLSRIPPPPPTRYSKVEVAGLSPVDEKEEILHSAEEEEDSHSVSSISSSTLSATLFPTEESETPPMPPLSLRISPQFPDYFSHETSDSLRDYCSRPLPEGLSDESPSETNRLSFTSTEDQSFSSLPTDTITMNTAFDSSDNSAADCPHFLCSTDTAYISGNDINNRPQSADSPAGSSTTLTPLPIDISPFSSCLNTPVIDSDEITDLSFSQEEPYSTNETSVSLAQDLYSNEQNGLSLNCSVDSEVSIPSTSDGHKQEESHIAIDECHENIWTSNSSDGTSSTENTVVSRVKSFSSLNEKEMMDNLSIISADELLPINVSQTDSEVLLEDSAALEKCYKCNSTDQEVDIVDNSVINNLNSAQSLSFYQQAQQKDDNYVKSDSENSVVVNDGVISDNSLVNSLCHLNDDCNINKSNFLEDNLVIIKQTEPSHVNEDYSFQTTLSTSTKNCSESLCTEYDNTGTNYNYENSADFNSNENGEESKKETDVHPSELKNNENTENQLEYCNLSGPADQRNLRDNETAFSLKYILLNKEHEEETETEISENTSDNKSDIVFTQTISDNQMCILNSDNPKDPYGVLINSRDLSPVIPESPPFKSPVYFEKPKKEAYASDTQISLIPAVPLNLPSLYDFFPTLKTYRMPSATSDKPPSPPSRHYLLIPFHNGFRVIHSPPPAPPRTSSLNKQKYYNINKIRKSPEALILPSVPEDGPLCSLPNPESSTTNIESFQSEIEDVPPPVPPPPVEELNFYTPQPPPLPRITPKIIFSPADSSSATPHPMSSSPNTNSTTSKEDQVPLENIDQNNTEIPPPPPLVVQSTKVEEHSRLFNVAGKLYVNRSDLALPSPDEEVQKAYVSAVSWGWLKSKSETLSVFTQLRPLLQIGPQCGLVALSMASQVFPHRVEPQYLLEEAKNRGYSAHGEMFSTKNFSDLANWVEGMEAEARTDLLSDPKTLLQLLLQGCLILAPYDSERNHMPSLQNGHKAHWGVICGCLVQGRYLSQYLAGKAKADKRIDNLWHIKPRTGRDSSSSRPSSSLSHSEYITSSCREKTPQYSDNQSTTGSSSLCEEGLYEQDMSVVVLIRHGKSRNLMLTPLEVLRQSNAQLFEYVPARDEIEKEYVIGSVEEGLKEQCLVLHKTKIGLSDLLGMLAT